jgi:peptide/nickel transport system substrate-binding protein
LLFGFLLFASACSDDKSSSTTTQNNQNVPQGGELIIGAEQEPDCTDWVDQCGGSSWGTWMMGVTTLPRAFDVVKSGDNYEYKPSVLLKGEPKLETSPQQKVTYEIADNAVWSDNQPITSHDFKYTWEQIAKGENIYDRSGFDKVESVDDSNPKVAVVTFTSPYSAWKGMYGVQFGVLPSHLLEGKDRDALMKDGYDWSGGPWVFKWEKGAQTVLTPNPNWYGPKPKLDKVTFKFITDTSAEFQAFKTGQVSAIYPQPQLDAVDQINAGLPDTNKSITDFTGNLEALWMNNQAPPFDDVKVRQAIGYIVDRDAIVQRLFGAIGVQNPMQTFNANVFKDFADTQAFSQYKKDLGKADELLTSAGYTKGSDGIYAKGGQKLSIQIQSTTGNKRRELTEQILQEQLKAGGIELTIQNSKSGDLFGQILPQGNFQLALYAQVATSFDPTLCNIYCTKNIPTTDNGFAGNNWTRTDIPAANTELTKVDEDLDDQNRKDAGKAADRALADQMASLPLDPLPNILLWNTKVVGPLGDNAIAGPFFNMELWGVQP